MNENKIGCVQHDCQECKDRERQSVTAGLQNIDRSVIEQALEWVEAQPEPRMLGAAKIITALREALAQPMTLNGHELFQDSEGTIPVTAIGQQVGFVAQPLIKPSGAGVFLDAPLAQPQPVVQSVQASQCHNVMCQPYCDATGELVLPLCKCKPANQQKD